MPDRQDSTDGQELLRLPRLYNKLGAEKSNILLLQGYKWPEVIAWLQLTHNFLIKQEAEHDFLKEYEELRSAIEDSLRHIRPGEMVFSNVVLRNGSVSSTLSQHKVHELIQRLKRLISRFTDCLNETSDDKELGRPKEAKLQSDHIIWDGKMLKISNNSMRARFCEKMFNHETKVGHRYAWDELYECIYSTESSDPDNWRKIDSMVRTLNEAAKKIGMPQLLKFTGGRSGEVERLR
ncbi:MAG: hypothetical protein WC840_03790 [Candidatus Peribacteraceae bacterium]